MHCVVCNAGFCFLSGMFDRTEACVSWVLCSQPKDCGRDGENWMGKVSGCFFLFFLLLISSFIISLCFPFLLLISSFIISLCFPFLLLISSFIISL